MKEVFEKVNCNVCGANDYTNISDKGQFGLATHVVICKQCGLSYLNPRWTKETYISFYTNEYDKYYRPNISAPSDGNVQKNPIYERLTAKGLLDQAPNNVLDIGSGAGANLLYFKSQYPQSNFHAIEPSDQACEILTANNITVIGRDVDSDWATKHTDKFDLIIMRHVLEHFSDPVAALQKVASTLSQNGLLYIAVPNNFKPTSSLLSNWFRVVHTYYFNEHSLKNVLHKSGLEALDFVGGDHFNRGELITYVKKSAQNNPLEISTEVYEKQLSVFQNKLKEDNKLIPSLRRQFKQLRQKTRFILSKK